MLFFDFYYLIVIGIGAAFSFWASAKTKGAFSKYGQIGTRGGLSGAEVASRILQQNGIHDVTIEPIRGQLTDHYDPRSRTLRLSEPVFGNRSMAALGVAAHEVGHAIQHAHGYGPLKFRSAWVPVANLGSRLSMILIVAAFFMQAAQMALGPAVALVAVLAFGTTTLFTLITLPVEFDASKRALVALESGGYTTQNELVGAKKVLDAAALTYVAAFASSLLMLLYWAFKLGLFGGGRSQD